MSRKSEEIHMKMILKKIGFIFWRKSGKLRKTVLGGQRDG